jgi:hypothetical protein
LQLQELRPTRRRAALATTANTYTQVIAEDVESAFRPDLPGRNIRAAN